MAARWKPGQSGNPSGRKKPTPDMKKLLAAGSIEVVNILLEIARDPAMGPKARCNAAQIILDKAYGKGLLSADASAEPVVIKFEGVLDEWAN